MINPLEAPSYETCSSKQLGQLWLFGTTFHGVLGCRTPFGVRLEVKHLEEKVEKYQEKEETIGKIKKHDDI